MSNDNINSGNPRLRVEGSLNKKHNDDCSDFSESSQPMPKHVTQYLENFFVAMEKTISQEGG